MTAHTLLICTVGGTPEPVCAAVKGWRPDSVIFLASPETTSEVETSILPWLLQEDAPLGPGQYRVIQVPDAQDLAGCVEKMRELGKGAEEWIGRGADYEVVVDLTGGTKCMSAALALVAGRWRCRLSYVGGAERTRDGKGVVVDGTERILHSQNPWDSLGYQAAEDGLVLFEHGDYQAAVYILDSGQRHVERPDLKAELAALKLLAEAYLAWDLFNHRDAYRNLGDVQKNANNLRHLLPAAAEHLLQSAAHHRAFLEQFQSKEPGKDAFGRHTILDLCANARRCAQRGRHDDAVARLYRAVESVAQLRLRDGHGLPDTKSVPLELVPEPLRAEWSPRAKEGTVLLGLQDAYRLLEALADELGRRFRSLGLTGEKGPLTSRNQSILAHGFAPVGQKVYAALWKATLALAEMREEELPLFPRLGNEQ